MATEYERTTYRTCEGLSNLRFTKCELSKTHVPKQLGTIKQIVIPNRNDGNYYGLSTEPRYLGVWERTSSGEEVHLGNSKNAIIQANSTLSIFEFDGIPNNGNGLILGLLVDANSDSLDELAPDDIGGRGNAGDSDGCILYTHAENANYTHLPDITFTIEYTVEVPDTPDTPDTPDEPDEPDEPTPDDEEDKLREVRIEEYWPLIVKNTAEFDQIAVAENPEFNNFAACIYRSLKDGFILEATEYGVERWEKMLGITPAEGSSLDDRKAAILNYLSIKTPYTWRVLKQMLVPILGGEDKFVMEYINDEGKLVLHTDRLDDAMLGTVDELLARVLPQNIEVVQYNHNIEVSWRDINKYADFETMSGLIAAYPDYMNDLTSEGEWLYNLTSLKSGDSSPNGLAKIDKLKIVQCNMDSLTSGRFFLRDNPNLEIIDCEFPKLSDIYGFCTNNKNLRVFTSTLPAIGGNNFLAFSGTQLEKQSALRVLRAYERLASWYKCWLGIHVDCKNDTEILEQISVLKTQGHTVSIQWNGTPTSGISAMDLEEIWCKVTESEYGEYTDENGNRCTLDWGHYVTDTSEYKLFFSLVEAEQYFKLKKVTENE